VRVHHVAFRTDDLEALRRFYADVLGLTIIRRSERSIWLDAAGTILMLEKRDDDEPRVSPQSKELVAFAVSKPMIDRLGEARIAIEARTAYTLYVRDPDGRRIGLSSYPDELP
jgi:glyoxylase I family protein